MDSGLTTFRCHIIFKIFTFSELIPNTRITNFQAPDPLTWPFNKVRH